MGDTIGRASAFVCLPKRPPTLLFPIPLTCITALTLAGMEWGERLRVKRFSQGLIMKGPRGGVSLLMRATFSQREPSRIPQAVRRERRREHRRPLDPVATTGEPREHVGLTLDNARANFQHGSTRGGQNAVSEQR